MLMDFTCASYARECCELCAIVLAVSIQSKQWDAARQRRCWQHASPRAHTHLVIVQERLYFAAKGAHLILVQGYRARQRTARRGQHVWVGWCCGCLQGDGAGGGGWECVRWAPAAPLAGNHKLKVAVADNSSRRRAAGAKACAPAVQRLQLQAQPQPAPLRQLRCSRPERQSWFHAPKQSRAVTCNIIGENWRCS